MNQHLVFLQALHDSREIPWTDEEMAGLAGAIREMTRLTSLNSVHQRKLRKVVRDTRKGWFTHKVRAHSDPVGTVTESV